ncbi:hypothetical protein DL98DRAFT_658144 [Cadophora sp. DSE1049]|nr:hypothetical protein DL98DRAFT_658144 [Cadophora sp. DSE1049]
MTPPVLRPFHPRLCPSISPNTNRCTIEDFYAAKQPFRVVHPGPSIFPYQLSRCSDKAYTIEDTLDTSPALACILRRHNLSNANTGMRRIERQGSQPPWTGFPPDNDLRSKTVFLIESRESDPTTWQVAAQEIYEFLLTAGFEEDEVQVEIWNSKLVHELHSFFLPDDRKMLAAMRSVKPRVYEVVRRVLRDSWTAIAYHMTGPRQCESKAVPTVIVYCRPGSVEDFINAEREIASVLDEDRHPDVALHLEILPGSTGMAAPPAKEFNPEFAWRWLYKDGEDGPWNGTSVGPRGSTQSGSLGGWVGLQGESGEVMEYAMTCYHVASPGDTDNKDADDEYGIGLTGTLPLSPITMVCPSPVDEAETRKFILERPARESMEQFEDSISIIGNVEYGSGNRRRTDFGSRLDWALISSPNLSNSLRNRPPVAFCYDHDNSDFEGYVATHDPSHRLLKISDSQMAGQWVCKAARSGSCDGVINTMYRRVRWDDGFGETMELEVLPNWGKKWFCHESDAGSWVVNANREVVGMLVEMDEYSCGILTPLKDILEDIRRATGYRVSLLQPRGSF